MTTSPPVIARTVQETHLWLKDVMEWVGGTDQQRAFLALRAVLHSLRDRIGPQSSAQLAAQLPMLLRGLFYEGWHPATPPSRERHRDEFLARVRAELPGGMDISAEDAAEGVFAALQRRIDPGENRKLQKLLPEELRQLWPLSA